MESSTKILRRMLDERGVEWTEGIARPELTQVRIDGKVVKFHPWQPNTLKVSLFDITPEQAIAAALGATDANPTQEESSGTCHDEGDPSDFCCSACGVRMFTNTSDTYTMIASDGRTIIKHPNYCPNCGRRIEQ